jgi:pimeloyl-ACP methyl ester carboxylesterase
VLVRHRVARQQAIDCLGDGPILEFLDAPQSLIARYYNLVRYTRLPRGGHFAFWEQPQAMTADVREFFRTLRG